VRPAIEQYQIPGMAVAIVHKGERSSSTTASPPATAARPVDEHTLFELGSVSKLFTATLGAYARREGKLRLDDKASQHLPALRGSTFEQISLLDLATYTPGGLPLQFPDAVQNERQMLDYYRSWQPAYPAGSQRLYSNPSIGLFGHLAAASLGQPFEQLLERQLFPQLGMTGEPCACAGRADASLRLGLPRRPGDPRAAGPAGCRGLRSEVQRRRHAALRRGQPRSLTAASPLRQAIATTHKGYYRVGDMSQGLGWERYAYPITLERLQAGNSTQMALEPHAVERVRHAASLPRAICC
jgi:beta-lactamase class C